MAKKLGNDYRLWIESSTPGTFNEVKGNTACKISRSSDNFDTSTKSDFPYGTESPGLKKLTLTYQIYPDLPDTTGYGRLETAALSAVTTPTNIQIRKGGSAGNGTTDVVFAASMYIGNFDTDFPKNGVVVCDFTLTLAAAPTTDALG